MIYGDLFDLEEEDQKYGSRYTNQFGSVYGMEDDKRFYKIYSALIGYSVSKFITDCWKFVSNVFGVLNQCVPAFGMDFNGVSDIQ